MKLPDKKSKAVIAKGVFEEYGNLLLFGNNIADGDRLRHPEKRVRNDGCLSGLHVSQYSRQN